MLQGKSECSPLEDPRLDRLLERLAKLFDADKGSLYTIARERATDGAARAKADAAELLKRCARSATRGQQGGEQRVPPSGAPPSSVQFVQQRVGGRPAVLAASARDCVHTPTPTVLISRIIEYKYTHKNDMTNKCKACAPKTHLATSAFVTSQI